MERGWTGSVCPLFQWKKSVLSSFYNLSFSYKVYFLQSVLFSVFILPPKTCICKYFFFITLQQL